MEQDVKKLELRIQELENQLKRYSVPKIDPKDMEVFRKVAGQLGFDPDYVCGINECKIGSPYICHYICRVCWACNVCYVCNHCIAECTCGPCLMGPMTSAGLSRFSELGK
jgi:hypothetical protein